MKVKKLIYGVGINNADYAVTSEIKVDGKRKVIWKCPFYSKWYSMLMRCYSKPYQIKNPTYSNCSTAPEWHSFMTFRGWMEKQDWFDKYLDKDILFPGNKIYEPDSCVFVEEKVNNFVVECTAARGQWPIGVSFVRGKFVAKCHDVRTGIHKHLGYFSDPQQAHLAWLQFKLEQAKILASQQSDPRVAKALIDRYQNYRNFN